MSIVKNSTLYLVFILFCSCVSSRNLISKNDFVVRGESVEFKERLLTNSTSISSLEKLVDDATRSQTRLKPKLIGVEGDKAIFSELTGPHMVSYKGWQVDLKTKQIKRKSMDRYVNKIAWKAMMTKDIGNTTEGSKTTH